MWSLMAHLSGFLGWFGWLGALAIYLFVRRRGTFARGHAAEAVNFQLMMLALYVVIALVTDGALLPRLLYLGGVVLIILAGVSAMNGRAHRYPVPVHLVR
jgi:hypothetical protein